MPSELDVILRTNGGSATQVWERAAGGAGVGMHVGWPLDLQSAGGPMIPREDVMKMTTTHPSS
jgi:hypothetical protein